MALTPILIPGKRKRDNTKAAIEARKALNRKQGRPLKFVSEDALLEKSPDVPDLAKRSKKRTLKTMKSRGKMSNLEKLPTELLEKVFSFCFNLDLPRSSPILAGKLSSQTIYSQTLLAAFGPTWDNFDGTGRSDLNRSEPEFGNPDFQSSILRCRWASLASILRAKDTWIQNFAENRVFRPIYFMESALRNPLPSRVTATEYFEADFQTFITYIRQVEQNTPCDDVNWGTCADVALGIIIPESILSGPWTEEKIRYLFWMTKSGARIDWLISTSGEIALEGFQDAICEGNLQAIHLLEWLGLAEKTNVDTIMFAIRNGGGNKKATVSHFMRQALETMLPKELWKIRRGLLDIRDIAALNGDEEQLKLVKEILETSLWPST